MNTNDENILKAWRVFRVILPLTYEQGLSYEEQLQRILAKVKELIENGFTDYDPIIAELTKELEDYVNEANANIRNETADRKEAVDSLNTAITDETKAREDGDANIRQTLADAVKVPQTGPLVRKYALIGDGLMNGEQGDAEAGHTGNGWGDMMAKCGLSVVYNSGNPKGFTYDEQIDSIGDPDFKTFTDVVLLGDLNSTTGDQVSAFIQKARNKFPNATIRIGSLRAGVLTQLTEEQRDAILLNGAQIVHLEALLAQNECVGSVRPQYLNASVQAKYAVKIAKAALDGFVIDTGKGESKGKDQQTVWLKYLKTNDFVWGMTPELYSENSFKGYTSIEPYFQGVSISRSLGVGDKDPIYLTSPVIEENTVKIRMRHFYYDTTTKKWTYEDKTADKYTYGAFQEYNGATGRRSLK